MQKTLRILSSILTILLTFTLLLPITDALADTVNIGTEECYPQLNLTKSQYIIGYGSLMEDSSRLRTAPSAVNAYPVTVKGYRRGWFAKGGSVGFDATYLGSLPADSNTSFNAVIYQSNPNEITATDAREYFYCRKLIDPINFDMMVDDFIKPDGQVWMYVNKPDSTRLASDEYPIVESYVDIFISGCLQQQTRYNLPDFAKTCISSTTDWSENWINDRIYPRRPFIYQPLAGRIDKLLSVYIPDIFKQIKIED